MLTDSELMRINVRALFTHNAESRLLFVNEPDAAKIPAPRLFLGRTRTGNIWRFRVDLPADLIEELSALCAAEPPLENEFAAPRHIKEYARLLERHAPVAETETNLAYYFAEDAAPSESVIGVTTQNAEVLRGGFEKLIEELATWQPFVALVKEDRVVSVCRSVRITREAHEAGVETLPEHRGNGFAKEVAANWARLVRAANAIPMYSTTLENHASQAVARKLGLTHYGTSFQIA